MHKNLLYIAKRLGLIVPTLFIILLINFVIINFAPGGPIETLIAKIKYGSASGGGMSSSAARDVSSGVTNANVAGSEEQDIEKEIRARLNKEYGLDKPLMERFWKTVKAYLIFDLGKSYYQDKPVTQLIKEKLPVSMTLGLLSVVIIYLISIPLGIVQAVRRGTKFSNISGFIVTIMYALPSFSLAVLLINLASSTGLGNIFPISGLFSINYDQMSVGEKVWDVVRHAFLPVMCIVFTSLASNIFFVRNCFINQISAVYVTVAKSRGCSDGRIIYRHVFRNSMLIVLAGLPATLLASIFTGSILIETIFSLDGIGLLSFNATINKDYPVIFGTLYMFSLIGLIGNLVTDLMYMVIDPRIDFETVR